MQGENCTKNFLFSFFGLSRKKFCKIALSVKYNLFFELNCLLLHFKHMFIIVCYA